MLSHEVLRSLLRVKASDRRRLDGRPTHARRPTAVVDSGLVAPSQPNNNVLGSALVSHGSTLVLCSVTAELSPVLPGRAASGGYLDVEVVYNAATCYATARSEAATMQPSLDDRDMLWVAEASSLLQRIFDDSGCVDLAALVISEGEACWAIKATCLVMQDDGGVLETCAAAVKHTLAASRMPTEVTLPDGTTQAWTSTATSLLRSPAVAPAPAVATIGFVYHDNGEHGNADSADGSVARVYPTEAKQVVVLVDPTAVESLVVDGFVTVAVVNKKLLSLTCHGGKPAAPELLQILVKFAEDKVA